MRVNSRKIIRLIEELAPVSLAEAWDAPGFQVGNIDAAVDKVMVALEVTEAVVAEAEEKSVDLLVVHHPFLFKPLSTVTDATPEGQLLRRLIRSDIHVYAAHTNLDSARDGLNDYLAGRLELERTEPLRAAAEDATGAGLGRIGYLAKPLQAHEMAARLKTLLDNAPVRVSGPAERILRKVAVCTGAGADLMQDAHRAGCDALVTGDVKYHEARTAEALGLVLIDGGHFETENIYMSEWAQWLRKRVDEKEYSVSVVLSSALKSPFQLI